MTSFTNPPPYSLLDHSPSEQRKHDGPANPPANPPGQHSPLIGNNYVMPPGLQNQPIMGAPAGYHPHLYGYNDSFFVYENYPSSKSKILGIMHVTLGLLSIVFSAARLSFYTPSYVPSAGITGGIYFLLNGAFGICAAKWPTRTMIKRFLVFNLLSVVLCLVMIVCAVIGVILELNTCNDDTSLTLRSCNDKTIAMNLALAVIAAVEAAASIYGMSLCRVITTVPVNAETKDTQPNKL